MKALFYIASSGLLALTIAHGSLAEEPKRGDPSVDGVVRIVEPRYNGFADGETVEVEVLISSDGEVEESKVVVASKMPFVNAWIQDAVNQWLFEPTANQHPRLRHIRFTLDSVHTDSPRGVRSEYESPLTLHIEYVEPTVWFIDRVNGAIPVKFCGVHKLPMTVRRLPIRHGIWGYSEQRMKSLKKYWRARKRRFPNAHQFAQMGCIVGSEVEAEVYVCDHCLKAREDWIADHPNADTEPY